MIAAASLPLLFLALTTTTTAFADDAPLNATIPPSTVMTTNDDDQQHEHSESGSSSTKTKTTTMEDGACTTTTGTCWKFDDNIFTPWNATFAIGGYCAFSLVALVVFAGFRCCLDSEGKWKITWMISAIIFGLHTLWWSLILIGLAIFGFTQDCFTIPTHETQENTPMVKLVVLVAIALFGTLALNFLALTVQAIICYCKRSTPSNPERVPSIEERGTRVSHNTPPPVDRSTSNPMGYEIVGPARP